MINVRSVSPVMFRVFLVSVHLLFAILSSGKEIQTISLSDTVLLETENGSLSGTLLLPESSEPLPLVIIISGSGPTDRNGNNPMMINNSLKYLAEELGEHGIASLRYDKRGIGASSLAGMKEDSLRFEHYVADAAGWVNHFKSDSRFSKIFIAGHSEGSLIGILAAQQTLPDGFISIAGPGRAADQILKMQLESQPEAIKAYAYPVIDSLKAGILIDSINIMYYSLFRPSVQPYLISWFHYDPADEIAKLVIPVLILQGTTDLQVSVEDAHLLKEASPRSKLAIIENMNHILKNADPDREKNIETYRNPDLPVMQEAIESISEFIKK